MHDHAHCAHGNVSNRTFAGAVTLNLLASGLGIFYSLKSHSMSLMADSIHNLSDVLSIVLVWWTHYLSQRPRLNPQLTYGYRRSSALSALFNGVLLFVVAIGLGAEALDHWINPQPLNPHIMAIMGLLGCVLNGVSAYFFHHEHTRDLNLKSVYLHLLYDALTSAAVVLAAGLVYFFGWQAADPCIALMIVVAMLYSSVSLVRHSLHLLLDGVPAHVNQADVLRYLEQYPGVISVHDLHIWGLSTREVALTAHLIRPQGALSDEELKNLLEYFKKEFHIDHLTLQIESGTLSDVCGRTTGC